MSWRNKVSLSVGMSVLIATILYFRSQSISDREKRAGFGVVPTNRQASSGRANGGASADGSAGAPRVRSETKADSTQHEQPALDVDLAVKRFCDPAISVKQRTEDLYALGLKGDRRSVEILMRLGDSKTYLNYAALLALGNVKAEGVVEYLEGKLNHPDSRVLSAAVRSLSELQGEGAIAAIGAVVKANRIRPDGYQDDVCAMCVNALGQSRSVSAIPILKAEMEEAVGRTLGYEYGTMVVGALRRIGKAECLPVLLAYQERLSIRANRTGNPVEKQCLKVKIKEVDDAVASIESLKGST